MDFQVLEKILVFWEQHNREEMPEYLIRLEREAEANHVSVISRECRALLTILLKLLKPRQILEVGTGTGFSALWFAWVSGPAVQITTMEMIEHRLDVAKNNFKQLDRYRQIKPVYGDARNLLAQYGGSYDFIFLDAAKRYYPEFLPHCIRLLKPGGLLAADDVFFEGVVLQEKIPHRRRSMGRGLKKYLREVLIHPQLTTHILPWGQGMAISLKKDINS